MLLFTRDYKVETTTITYEQIQNHETPKPVAQYSYQKLESSQVQSGQHVAGGSCPYKDLIYKYFGNDDGKIAVAIAMGETGCNPNAHNDGDSKYYPYVASTGLFQHHEGYFEGWNDPEISTRKALEKFKARGWTPWSVYTNGQYLKYL